MSNGKIVITRSAKGTKFLGKKIAQGIIEQGPADRAFVLALQGDLGSGKTTFLQGFAEGLGVKDKITSPTFVLMKKFMVYGLKFKAFYHIDCYRLQKPEEILELGWPEIIANPQNIVAIEWPEKIKKFLPQRTARLGFKFISKSQRKIKFGKAEFLC